MENLGEEEEWAEGGTFDLEASPEAAPGFDPETGDGYFEELEGVEAEAWKQELNYAFKVPPPVNTVDGETGKRIVFPNLERVSPLVRISVLENMEPPRHKTVISLGDWRDEASEEWAPVHYFYAFACPMPQTLPYTVEHRREPNCTRLRQSKAPQPRDVTTWTRDAPVPKGFFAFPEPVAGSSQFSIDWSSGPDRYQISDEHLPQLGWLRCFRFQAYKARFALLSEPC
mmetsp:Transcript_59119/g.133855  ORF Transcript_59119/g.133855 Transcript_59119/m.133855 type:complete len:228 (-) Transcript_59119:766-1449(-)